MKTHRQVLIDQNLLRCYLIFYGQTISVYSIYKIIISFNGFSQSQFKRNAGQYTSDADTHKH